MAAAAAVSKGDNTKKSVPSKTPFSTWFIRFLPAIIFASYVYSTRGPFQSRACLAFGYNCRTFDPLNVQGTIDADRSEIYGPVTDYYSSLFTSHEDLGGSLAVFVEGKPVIDIIAGSKDLEGRVPYDNQTLQQVYSSGKAVEGIVIARLVQKGLLDYETKVSQYWPEFAQNGKENVRLVDVMAHESGVFHLDDDNWDLTWASLQDKEAFSARLAKQGHYFGGDIKRAYQAISRGWYLNEIVRRVDPQARTIGGIAKDELMVDYPDLELHYGRFDNDDDWETRLSPMVEYPVLKIVARLLLPRFLQINEYIGHPDIEPLHPLVGQLVRKWSISSKALTPRMAPFAKDFRTKQAHAVESTSFSLKTNAHSLAKLMAMMANKGASLHPGQEPDLLTAKVYTEATTYHSSRPCIITHDVLPLSRGGWVKHRNFHGDGALKGVEVQGWGGAGGSLALWIEDLDIGFSYVTNAFGAAENILGDFRGRTLLEKVVYARKKELGLLP
ncbi:hypothetical protein KI688_003701 [Linnemannia hyalina]|uniref:Beta-lactamase-related domain-containing protein n=1 Tax=Linnemannia hyalina TaxID=64524 RepID=A0A9P8BR07_9FUNG|nr:hypothetical protein KI688_003701 [Linnemannia hyalina]